MKLFKTIAHVFLFWLNIVGTYLCAQSGSVFFTWWCAFWAGFSLWNLFRLYEGE